MNMADSVTKIYMSNNDVFADAVNYALFDGEEVIAPSCLRPLNAEEVLNISGTAVQRHRDLFKAAVLMTNGETDYLLIGIENQTEIDYAMPIRNAVYDSLAYSQQVQTIAMAHRQRGEFRGRTNAEFLSGFLKEDRVRPVATVVVYFGPGQWDGARSLKELRTGGDPRLDRYMLNLEIPLIEPAAIREEDFSKFRTDMGRVMRFTKYSEDKVRLAMLLDTDRAFRKLRVSAAQVLNTCSNIGINIETGREEIDMCRAIREMQQDAVDKAVREVTLRKDKEVSAIRQMQQDAVDKAVREVTLRKDKEASAIRQMQQDAVDKAVQEALSVKEQEAEKLIQLSKIEIAKAIMASLKLSADAALTAMQIPEAEQTKLIALM